MSQRALQLLTFLALALALALGGLVDGARAQGHPLHAPGAVSDGPYAGLPADQLRAEPWPEETLELAATLPLQHGGRVKPLSSWAGFKLLKFNGKRTLDVTLPGGAEETLDPTGWMLDALFFPLQARSYRQFLVRDDALLTVLGLSFEDRKRSDRYSFDELARGRQELMTRAQAAADKEPGKRTRLERDLLILGSNVREFEDLILALEFTRAPLDLDATPFLAQTFDDPRPGVTVLLEHLDALRARWDAAAEGALPPAEAEAELAAAEALMGLFGQALQFAALGPGLVPPAADAEEKAAWYDAGQVLEGAVSVGGVPGAIDRDEALATVPLLAALERAEAVKTDPGAFRAALSDYHDGATARAEARGEYSKVPLEVAFYRTKYFTRSLALFLLGFLLVAVSWMVPAKPLTIAAWVATGSGALLVIAGVAMRCIIRSRPPVSTLYETILFITGSAVVVALFAEWVTRQRIALSMAALFGAAGMFLSMRYELKEAVAAGDTMPSLVAVLDTNFWLATHVTTVTLGYAAGLLASVFSHVWLLAMIFGLGQGRPEVFRTVTKITYGVLCFGLLFAVVGTILGGVWANYSWGRFWGWDPKENGALMIVLWQLMILHSRLGGYVRQFGFHILSLLGGSVVVFSWWHVNQLGVGLHSYGFTNGVLKALYITYGIELLLFGVAMLWYFIVGPKVANGARPGPPAV